MSGAEPAVRMRLDVHACQEVLCDMTLRFRAAVGVLVCEHYRVWLQSIAQRSFTIPGGGFANIE